ncbi:MAG: hypothetical protein GYA48_15475 [Chloroflexi bacterium]|nr:hypothetical protein [Chloroflexota bacterium]
MDGQVCKINCPRMDRLPKFRYNYTVSLVSSDESWRVKKMPNDLKISLKDGPSIPLHQSIEQISLISDAFARRLTPAPFRENQSLFRLGDFVAALPGILMFLPVLWDYFSRGKYGTGFTMIVIQAYVLVLSFSLVAYGKRKLSQVFAILDEIYTPDPSQAFHREISRSLTTGNQALAGAIMAVFGFLFAQLLAYANILPIWARIGLSLAEMYTGFFVGVGLYVAINLPRLIDTLSGSHFEIKALLPFQTPELYEVAEVSASFSFTASVLAALLTIQLIILELVSKAFFVMVWNGLISVILLVSWFVMLLPFLTTQTLVRKIIKCAKKERLSLVNDSIARLMGEMERSDHRSIEELEKMQRLAENIFQSPNAVLNLNIVGKFASSFFLTVTPMLINLIFH